MPDQVDVKSTATVPKRLSFVNFAARIAEPNSIVQAKDFCAGVQLSKHSEDCALTMHLPILFEAVSSILDRDTFRVLANIYMFFTPTSALIQTLS